MSTRDGRLTVTYNGEIYNYLELKKELSDFQFTSHSDTIEQRVHLDRRLGRAKECPRKYRQPQVDHGRVEPDQLVLEAELACALRLGGDRLE